VFLDSDLVLGVGCRFADRHTGSLDVYTRGRQFIHIDIEPTQISRIFPSDLGIVSDARLALQALLEEARAQTPPRSADDYVQKIPQLRRELARRLDFDNVPIKPGRVFKEINEFFDEDTIFVTCIGNNQIWSGQMQEIYKPGHYLLAGGAGPLGWDLPAAIGAKLARPNNTVVNVTGDFGIQFCIEELAMAAQYEVPVLVVIINNGNMSLIRQNQKYAYNGLRYGIDLTYGEENSYLDFVQLARAYGLYGERITRPDEIKGAFRRGLDSGKTALIDIIIERDADVSMGNSIDAIREFEPLPQLVPALS